MVVRVHLGAADVARVRLAGVPHPLGAAVLSAQLLRRPAAMATLPALSARHESAARSTAAVRELVPGTGYIPDFMTPLAGVDSIDAGIAALHETRLGSVRADLVKAYAGTPLTTRRRQLMTGDQKTLHEFTTAMHRYFTAVLAPEWPALVRATQLDVARRTRTMALSGVDAVLNGLHPAIRWRAPQLEIDTWWDGDASPDGRGLLLVPSMLAGPRPRLMRSAGGPTLLVYPIVAPHQLAGPRTDPLRALLGRSRAEVLRRLAGPGPHSTSSLAAALAISAASASEHSAALRHAGLIETRRAGRRVIHSLTPLGADLVETAGWTGT
jgi:DNA-binding transcriptional ArsR family regulator